MFKFAKVICFCFITIIAGGAAAQSIGNISQQQLEQFKKLPPAQQRALAQSMGIDYKTIQAQLKGKSNQKGAEQDKVPQQYYPRGTQFDEFGNPIFDENALMEEKEEEDEDELKPFGYEVFANAPLTFAPSIDIAIPNDYIIGAGDTLLIQIFGTENEEHELPVSRDGKIIVPSVGAFTVSGLTFEEVKKLIPAKVKERILGVDVLVSLSEQRSIRVFVSGDAFKPGPYVLGALSSMTHAIFAAGGISDIGSLRKVELKRAGKTVSTLDLYDLLINGDSSNDAILRSGDVLFVAPVGDRITVDGEVTRPAIYEIKHGETFADVVKMAGGLLPSAFPSSTIVERFNNQNLRTIVNVDLTNESALASKLSSGDYIRVMPTSSVVEESVTLIGAVPRPGKYQWHEGQKLTDLLPSIHTHVLESADISYGLVVREKDIGRNIEVLQFNLFKAVSDSTSDDNLSLQARDKVLIFSNIEVETLEQTLIEEFALTKEALLKREKELAEQRFEERMFWQHYGEDSDPYANLALEEIDKADETIKEVEKSLEELMGKEEEPPSIREHSFFSRKRMLQPIIEQLKRQAGTGEPIQLVEVAGAVKYPGIYPLAKNITASDLVVAAGGLLESAYLQKADITRYVVSGESASKQNFSVNLSKALANESTNDKLLQSKDRLNIHHIPEWQGNHIVELKGEFKFPGKYAIKRGETLGDLIERAGGFTPYAYTKASLFTREKLKQLELQNILKVSESLRMEIASKSLSSRDGQSIDYEQAKLLLADLTKVTPVGRLVVDIPGIVADSDVDVLLEDGDVLYVPSKQNSVNVVGQVQVATSHIYRKGLDAFNYVDLSGGVKEQADDDRIYIIKANGSVEIPNQGNWFTSASNHVEPGDTVVVPLDSAYMDNLSLWATATQIIYQAAVAIAAISGV